MTPLLAVPLPDGYTHVRRDRHDPVTVTEHTFRDVTISPAGVDPATFTFGTPGAYAHISVDDGGDTVGVFATGVGYQVQCAGHVVHFANAPDAVRCALGHLRGELQSQQRGG